MSGTPVRIRTATAADADALLALEQHFPGDRMSRRSIRHLLRAPSATIWLAQARGETLGALILLTRGNSRRARIYSLVVSPAARGQGLGSRLVLHAQREARRRGFTGMSLEVRDDNHAARALYAALGYRPHAVLPRYYEDHADGVRLRRDFT